MARGKKNKPTDAPGLDALQKAVDSAAAEVADLKDEISRYEQEQAELREEAQALPEGDSDRADLESRVAAIEVDGLDQARKDLQQAEAKLAAAQPDLAAAVGA